MKRTYYSIATIILVVVFLWGCKRHSVNEPANVTSKDDKIFITDRTGTSWDITHAVNEYRMNPSGFQYGLGPYAITPINNPEMILPGEPGYPVDNNTELVVGININGEARAYPIRILSRHEAVNDRIGDLNFLVGC